jgi:hypothetical protein
MLVGLSAPIQFPRYALRVEPPAALPTLPSCEMKQLDG